MGKRRVLLVHPEISRTKYNFAGVIENEPLELEYIVPILEAKGYDTEIFDKVVEKISIEKKLAEYNPDVFYVCGRTKQENFMKECCKAAKDFNEKVITIVGGLHAQNNWNRLYANEINYILTTFDIFKIIDILEIEENCAFELLENITGLCYKQEGKWIKNVTEPFDIKRLPHPDRTYFYSHLENYRYLELLPCAQVRTAYSCVYNCKFCYRNTLNCGKYVSREIEDVVDEIEGIKCDNIYFVDDDFLITPARVKRFIELIRERGIKKNYVCYGRADYIVKNKDIIRELKEIGFYYLLVGLEAITDEYLDNYNKHVKMDWNIECINFLNEIGINIMGLLILDLDFSARDFKEMYRWIEKHEIKHVAPSVFTPELGLKIYDDYKERIVTDNPEHWDYLHVVAKPSKMSVRAFYIHYYILMIKLFIRGKRQGVYDFINYEDYIKSLVKNIFMWR